MGAENSVLEGCEWGEEVLASGLDWDLQHATSKDDRPITVFQPRRNERKYNDMMQQLAKSLKMLRHPNILRYIGAGKFSEGSFLVSERATPLPAVLDKLSPLELCAGFSDILDAVIFLHDKAGVTHNNICVVSIFVTEDGGWKLGELQHACPFSSATAEFLDACRAFRNQDTVSPEEKQSKVEIKNGQGHARDIYALGILFESFTEQLSELGEYSKSFEQKIGACLSGDPSLRPRALELRNDSLFQNDFIQILSFVRNVALKTTEEKAEFFSTLLPRLLALPEELVARRLATPLLSRFVLLDEGAVTHVVPHLLTPRSDSKSSTSDLHGVTPVLSEELFKKHVIPKLEGILLVHDAHIRMVLLKHFSAYVHLFNNEVLQNDIFPQVLLGLRDTDDAIVASSLRALADLVPFLGGDVVIGGQRRTFFFHGMPRFSPSKETDTQPSNVGDILKPLKSVKSPAVVNGKPLLMDLAAGYTPKPKKDPEQERKLMEREKRREEARLRKEERQRRFKQQQAEAEKEAEKVKSMASEMESSRVPSNLSDVAPGLETVDKMDPDADSTSTQTSKTKSGLGDILKDNNEETVTEADSKNDDSELIEEEKFASEVSEEEWEDWEDNQTKSVFQSEDDVISEEIEAELSRMSGGQGYRGSGKKVPTSPDPYIKNSAVRKEWSDSQFDSEGTNPRQFKSNSRQMETQETDKAFYHSSLEKSPESKQTSGKGLKLVAKNKSATTAKTAQAKKSTVHDDFGQGYDIKSIELSVVKEVDFFADMVPSIKPQADKDVLGVGLKMEKEVKPDRTTEGTGMSRFAMVEETAQESGGWDDEGDWGGEDF